MKWRLIINLWIVVFALLPTTAVAEVTRAVITRRNVMPFELELGTSMISKVKGETEISLQLADILRLDEQISLQLLPLQVRQAYAKNSEPPFAIRPSLSLKNMEKELILSTLRQTEDNRTRTAKILSITRQTLQNKLKEYKLS